MNEIFTLKRTNTLEVFLLGFESDVFEKFTPPPSKDENFYFFNQFSNTSRVLQQLNDRLGNQESGALPYAILCHYDVLAKDNFALLKQIQQDTQLKQIPFIVLSEKEISLPSTDLLRWGIDDLYIGQVSWQDLSKRLAFLARFKQDMLQLSDKDQVAEPVEFNMPLSKRIFDIAFALSVLTVLSPMLLLIALLIKMESKGPVIYKSKRVGTGYQVFNFLKFRSMCQDADVKLEKLQHLNHYSKENGDGTFIKIKNDPRVTRIGKFIRKTSLDEIPQFVNVLMGQMSIVGNRPLPMYEAEQMTRDKAARRFWAPAGLTGLWQTSGKGKDNMTVDERIGLDIEYADHFGLIMDAKIMSRTLPAMIQKEA